MEQPATEPKRNGYEDSDFEQVIDEIEGFEDEITSIKAEAAGRCSQVKKKIENAKKSAKSLGIPKSTLNGVLKTRKLERQMAEIAEGIAEEEIELFEDAVGQFSWLKPSEDEGDKSGASLAAARAKSAADAKHDQEQAEGAEVLDSLTTGATH